MSCKLYSTGRHGQQILMFPTVSARRRFLIRQREQALRQKQQLLYKDTEYLRIYTNCVLYQEYDIKARKIDHKQQAERFFKHG
jgi:hypothetical protein